MLYSLPCEGRLLNFLSCDSEEILNLSQGKKIIDNFLRSHNMWYLYFHDSSGTTFFHYVQNLKKITNNILVDRIHCHDHSTYLLSNSYMLGRVCSVHSGKA